MAETENKFGGASARQIMLVTGGALIAALLLFAMWYLIIRTSYAPAFTDLKSADASLIIEELKRQKIPYELTDNGTTVTVPENQVDVSRVNILGGDLPLKGTVGFELFNQSDMGLTEFAQKINYQRALQGELARTLMSLENIETARVHLSLPDSSIFERDKRAAKASVTVAPKLGKKIDIATVTGIQKLISSAVPELDTASVAILDAQGQLLSQEVQPANAVDDETSGNPDEQEYAMRVRNTITPLIVDPDFRVTVRIAQDLTKMPSGGNLVGPIKDKNQPSVRERNTERAFPIRISIIFANTPDNALRDILIPALTKSVNYDPNRGDSLIILTSPNAAPITPLPPPTTKEVVKDQGDWNKPRWAFQGIWIWFFLGLILVPLLLVAIRKLTMRRAMTADQREAFSDKLRVLVDEQGRRGSGAL